MRFRAIQFAKDDDLLLGESVLALGNPFGLGSSVSRGILSSKTAGLPQRINRWMSIIGSKPMLPSTRVTVAGSSTWRDG